MKHEKHTCFLKIHFVLVLCYTTLEFVCSATTEQKLYIMGHVIVCVVNSYRVMIHIFPPSDLFFSPSLGALIKDVIY